MTQTTENTLVRYRSIQSDPYIVSTPTIPTGKFAEDIYQAFTQAKKERFKDNENLVLELQNNQLVGSNLFTAVLLDELVRPNFRVACPEDWDEKAEALIYKKFYSDTPAAVLRSITGSYNPSNNPLAERLAQEVDMQRVEREPALITGLSLENADNEYGLLLVPNERFNTHYDERLHGRFDGWKYDTVDELGLPEHLDPKKGNKTLHTRDDGLSGFCVGGSLDRGSGYSWLAYSDVSGRVVLVSGEATAPNFLRNISKEIDTRYDRELANLTQKRDQARKAIDDIFGK